jgi:formylmethanofuran dehydrogenase subunit E
MTNLTALLEISSRDHSHICPRQVLGVRIGLAGMAALGFVGPPNKKRLLVIAETDGCFVDGLSAAVQCSVGHRTLRVEDYGKIAATFVDTQTGKAVRVAPRFDVRERAWAYAPEEKRKYFAQLHAYQAMPDEELLSIQEVRLTTPIEAILSRPGVRTTCSLCGEEIMNEREVIQMGMAYCRACAGQAYYQLDVQPVGVVLNAPALAE